MKKEVSGTIAPALPATSLPCLCAVTRKAGRSLTRIYDAFLKPSGLKVTQYSMLANIARNPGIAVTPLAQLLIMDQTTVTRNLGVLEKSGFVGLERASDDRRTKLVYLTRSGAAKLEEARPYWEQAQVEMEKKLGREDLARLLDVFRNLLE